MNKSFKKIRKEDRFAPKSRFYKKVNFRQFDVLDSTVSCIDKNSEGLLIFIHGGAFISGPAKHHWDSIEKIAKGTNQDIWLCNYPKAPENKISTISHNIDKIYLSALEKYDAENIILIGDSVGGTLITALTQRLVRNNQNTPDKIILISPVMDAAMANPEIEKINSIDPMLSHTGVLSAKKMCVENNDLTDPQISPLNGSFDSFPKTYLFVASNDITYPDQLSAIEKMRQTKVDLEVIFGPNMPHIWPLMPVIQEAKIALNKIIGILND